MPSLDSLLPLAVFLVVVLLVWAGLTALADHRGRAVDRVERLLKQTGLPPAQSTTLLRNQARIQTMVARAAPTLARPLTGKEAEIGRLQLQLLNAGFRGEQAVPVYLAIKFTGLLLALAASIPIAYIRHGLDQTTLIEVVAAAGAAFYLPGIVLHFLKKSRQGAIFLSLPDALDLMVVCVEAGLGLDAAMRRVAAELAASAPVLCEELAIANFQVQMGRARRDVLRDLGRRTGVADIRSLAAILIQAERFGSSIAVALRVQSDSMRVRRRQLAEERAAKTAVQLIFPLVLFIFPGIFVVLVGPAGIQISKMMSE